MHPTGCASASPALDCCHTHKTSVLQQRAEAVLQQLAHWCSNSLQKCRCLSLSGGPPAKPATLATPTHAEAAPLGVRRPIQRQTQRRRGELDRLLQPVGRTDVQKTVQPLGRNRREAVRGRPASVHARAQLRRFVAPVAVVGDAEDLRGAEEWGEGRGKERGGRPACTRTAAPHRRCSR
eukprot:353568-Chlamydomonas_euryale.AAC.1